jgi:hypothetical protein
MVECSVAAKHQSHSRRFVAGAIFAGRRNLIVRVHLHPRTYSNSLTHLHIPCNTTLSPRPILLGVDAGVPCRRSSAPPRLAKRRRLRLLLVVVPLPHQHQHRLRNLRQNPPTSRQMSPSLPLPYLNLRQSRSPPQPLRNQRLRPPNNRPCDSRSRDNMCDSQIL